MKTGELVTKGQILQSENLEILVALLLFLAMSRSLQDLSGTEPGPGNALGILVLY